MSYIGIDNQKNITIDNIYSVHYFEYAKTFSFEGEAHDFWEFIYVDKGTVNIVAGSEHHTLQSNEIFFHEPNEFHTVQTNGITAPNLIVVSFSCRSEIMQFFKHQKLTLDQQEQTILGRIIAEARICFDCRLDNPYLKTLPLNSKAPFGTKELLFNYLEQFLIALIRQHASTKSRTSPSVTTRTKATKRMNDAQLFREIIVFMQDNIHTDLSVSFICQKHSISRSTLQRLFKRHCNLCVTEYIAYLRIEKAKEIIRSQNMNFTQISTKLGYSSMHYFSRQFKKISGMTPSEYASSVKLMSEKFSDTIPQVLT